MDKNDRNLDGDLQDLKDETDKPGFVNK